MAAALLCDCFSVFQWNRHVARSNVCRARYAMVLEVCKAVVALMREQCGSGSAYIWLFNMDSVNW